MHLHIELTSRMTDGLDHGADLNCAPQVALLTELTGYFELDSNRLYDVLLNAFEQQPTSQAFLQLVKPLGFQPALLAQYLGFKFQQAHVRMRAASPCCPAPSGDPPGEYRSPWDPPCSLHIPRGARAHTSCSPGRGDPTRGWGGSGGTMRGAGSPGGVPRGA